MKPIVLIHGYSAESKKLTPEAISGIYGDLPDALRREYGADNVIEIDLARYISLDDGISLDDIARAMHRELNDHYPHLLSGGFHAVVHSTGALVIRNWLRKFSSRPSPLQNLVYLAGASFGSGWAHIGKTQFAKWGRLVFGANERGVRILDGLEFGSDWTIDLQRHFLKPENSLPEVFAVYEHLIIGSQSNVDWFVIPVRYAKEDGADGVVRVPAGNLNFNYVNFSPTAAARETPWPEARRHQQKQMRRSKEMEAAHYEVKEISRPGANGRKEIPFAIPFECAHMGKEMGIVTGSKPRTQVMKLIDLAIRSEPDTWQGRIGEYRKETASTYEQVKSANKKPSWFRKWVSQPLAQYDRHAQIIFRLRDQDGRPVRHYDIFFDSVRHKRDKSLPLRELMEHKHINSVSPNIIVFYLRTNAFNTRKGDWIPRVPDVNGSFLEVTAMEPETDEIVYLPFRYQFSREELIDFIQPDRTTVIDIELLRIPSDKVYTMVKS